MVASADDSDSLTYIDQELSVSVNDRDADEDVLAIITDANGNIISRVPLTCSEYSSSCSARIGIDTIGVKSELFSAVENAFHDGAEEYFTSKVEGATTAFFVNVAIIAICVVVGIIAGTVSGGIAAIPIGTGCFHALKTLYGVVKSIAFLYSLVTYYNIIDDNLGSYENDVFPNRYLSAIEVGGTTHSVGDIRLNRLNDVSMSDLTEVGQQDSLEYFGFSPVDFEQTRNDLRVGDHENVIQISGNTEFESLLILNPSISDSVCVVGTGEGDYSIIGIYNDANRPVGADGHEFATVFMNHKDEPTSTGSMIFYDAGGWYEEADTQWSESPDESDRDTILIWVVSITLVVIVVVIATISLITRRRKRLNDPYHHLGYSDVQWTNPIPPSVPSTSEYQQFGMGASAPSMESASDPNAHYRDEGAAEHLGDHPERRGFN
jgi:hypothetical protein